MFLYLCNREQTVKQLSLLAILAKEELTDPSCRLFLSQPVAQNESLEERLCLCAIVNF